VDDPVYIEPEKLTIGMFVILNLSWLKHPFTFSSFVIQSADQIATIRELGLARVQIDPLRSRLVPKPSIAVPSPKSDPAPVESRAPDREFVEKSIRTEQNRALRSNIAAAEKKAVKAAMAIREATRQFIAKPAEAIAATETLISEIADSLMGNSDVMVHLLNDKVAGEEIYYHSLNVTMLALLMGKALELDGGTLRTIGVAAVFHDIGKEEIPSRVLLKTDPLSHAEVELIKQHPMLGAKLALQAKMPAPVVAAILQHHENSDGSGYPHALSAEKIELAAKVIAIANHYDNLCNPANIASALTPYEALATMFAKRKGWFDQGMLSKLVRVLGVYPPGSIIQLSNGATGMVISVNSLKPLQPTAIVYDASVPKSEAIILDLEKTPEVTISKALRPSTLTPSVLEYLSPRKRVTYYFGEESRVN
jgi:putative nucleotidyltransferase with HDIG domain